MTGPVLRLLPEECHRQRPAVRTVQMCIRDSTISSRAGSAAGMSPVFGTVPVFLLTESLFPVLVLPMPVSEDTPPSPALLSALPVPPLPGVWLFPPFSPDALSFRVRASLAAARVCTCLLYTSV